MNKTLESKILTAESKLRSLQMHREKLAIEISFLNQYIDSLKNDLEVKEDIER